MKRILALMLLVSTLAGTLALHTVAHAQTASPVDPLTVDINPNYPTPYSTVTILPSSTLFDISGSTVTVTVNGSKAYSGSGSAPIHVQVGGPGATTSIVVSVVNAGQTYSKTYAIHPEQVALIPEPTTTTHPFYAGKGLIGSESKVRFVAIPDLRTSSGAQIDPATLEYTWRMDDQILESNSGIGKSVLSATAPQKYRDVTVSVTVQNTDGTLFAEAATPVSAADPFVRIYRDDPLLGPLYNVALPTSILMNTAEDTYVGVPYYFSSAPSVDWQINGTDSSSDDAITLRSSGNGQGTANLSFTATDEGQEQTANTTMQVQFGSTGGTGLFGL